MNPKKSVHDTLNDASGFGNTLINTVMQYCLEKILEFINRLLFRVEQRILEEVPMKGPVIELFARIRQDLKSIMDHLEVHAPLGVYKENSPFGPGKYKTTSSAKAAFLERVLPQIKEERKRSSSTEDLELNM